MAVNQTTRTAIVLLDRPDHPDRRGTRARKVTVLTGSSLNMWDSGDSMSETSDQQRREQGARMEQSLPGSSPETTADTSIPYALSVTAKVPASLIHQ